MSFQCIVGEIVLPPKMLISQTTASVDGKKVTAGKQFTRAPFFASFQAGWFKFDICTVHLYYGSASGAKLEQRIEEIDRIAKFLSTEADRALGAERALILLGDFNIVSPEHRTMEALTQHGFVVPKALQEKPSTPTAKHYDQVAFKTKPDVIEYTERKSNDPLQRNAGVISLFDSIFSDAQFKDYRERVALDSTAGKKADTAAKLRAAHQQWRTYQFSDHYPMWVRLRADDSDAYLERLRRRLPGASRLRWLLCGTTSGPGTPEGRMA